MEGQPLLLEDVFHFLHLGQELRPFLRVVCDKGASFGLLRDNDEGTDLRIGTAFIIAEVAL